MPEPVVAPVIADEVLAAVAEGRHSDPHSVLGQHGFDVAHERGPFTAIRTRRPLADSVDAVLADGTTLPLEHVGHGVWAGAGAFGPTDYRVVAHYNGDTEWSSDDPYRFAPTIGELDLHLIAEGRHEELWKSLGARYRDHWGVTGAVHGTAFTVWAPRARAVRVVGEFNRWDGTGHAMRSMGASGVWELFVPDLEPGTIYKFEILTGSGAWVMKADPMARQAEIAPATASVVSASTHDWRDGEWMSRRAATNPHELPMCDLRAAPRLVASRQGLPRDRRRAHRVPRLARATRTSSSCRSRSIRSAVPGATRSPGTSPQRAATARPTTSGTSSTGCTRPASACSWTGCRGTSRKTTGRSPASTASRSTSTPTRGAASSSTGAPTSSTSATRSVRNFLVANALFWLEEFHVDGLRVDAVASMLYLDYSREEGQWEPNIYGGRENLEALGFLQEANATAYKRNPGIVMIAEESTSWPGVTAPTSSGGLGFGYKWNMGWMHDTLQYIQKDPMYRSHHHNDITFSFLYAFSENFVLPISHDEVVHGKGSLIRKMPGDHWQQLANVRAYLSFMWAHPGKQLLFMGQEFGQPSEWSEERGLDWWILDQPTHQAARRVRRRRSTAPIARCRSSGSSTTTRPASNGSRAVPRPRTSSRSCATTANAGRCSASSTSPGARTTGSGSGCRSRAAGARC